MNKSIFNLKNFVTNNLFIKKALELKLNLNEFLMLTFFDNMDNNYLNLEDISKCLGISGENTYKIFNSLLKKKLIIIETEKDKDGLMIEKVNLEPFYELITEEEKNAQKNQVKNDIFTCFEQEFGRTITTMEVEIIKAWLEKNYSEEMIKGALKEAVYNGVCKLNYIDKILFEWHKKGFKNMNDVNSFLNNKDKKNEKKEELFDYDWMNVND